MEGTPKTFRVDFPEITSEVENVSSNVVTFSEIVTVKASYIWRIQNFNWTKLKRVGVIESEIFYTKTSDLTWRMAIESDRQTDGDVMTIRINLQDPCKEVKAKYMFYILDNNQAKSKEGAMPTAFNPKQGCRAVSAVSIRYLTEHVSDILLPNGHLTILCQVTSELELNCGISRDFGLLLESGRLSDMKLRVKNVQFSVHRSVLAARSPVFASMFESKMIESQENVVEISDIEPEVIEELLKFIYTEKVENLEVLALEMFAAADKYALEDLKFKCETVLCNNMDVENAVTLLIHADLHGSERLKSFARQFIFVNAVEVAKTAGYKSVDSAHIHLLIDILPINSPISD